MSSSKGTPVLDPRTAQDFYAEVTALQPAFVPELVPAATGTTAALLQMLSRFSAVVTQRLNQAPDLDKLTFLEMMGISLIPAQPARAPLVFEPLQLVANSQIPAGTRAGASLPGVSAPMVFETENTIAMTAAQLVQVVSLWPDRDAYIDHSNDLAGGRRFTLFDKATPVEHVLYLSQKTLLAFLGKSTVEVRFTLATPGSKAVNFRWEFWDGSVWRSFEDFDSNNASASQDGTAGLTRSGTVTLRAGCGDSAKTSVSNIPNYWIRARLTAPLPPDPSRTFAIASQINLRTTIDRSLTHGPGGCKGAAQIDSGYAGNTTLDMTKTFYPMGKAPGTDAVFYFTSHEIFSKPGAHVTLCIDLATTPEQEANKGLPTFAAEVTQAGKDLTAAAIDVANSLIQYATFMINLFLGFDTTAVTSSITALTAAIKGVTDVSGIAQLKTPFESLASAVNGFGSPILTPWSEDPSSTSIKIGSDPAAAGGMLASMESDLSALSDAYKNLSGVAAISAAVAGGAKPPELSPPRLVWEYFNGTEWLVLVGPSGSDTVNLMASGEITFTVPQDISSFTLNSSSMLGMRARLASGSYDALNLISWTDPNSGQTNFIPVLQPRPPALKDLAIGYTYRSAWTSPDESLTWNDFKVESHTPTAATPAANYAPFHPVADTLPSLYLGFNQPLPNDYLSIYLDIVESDTDGPPLVWEGWSEGVWQTLTVSDDTGALARSGMVAFLDPGAPARASAAITSASGYVVKAANALAAAQFQTQAQIVVQPSGAAEVVTIDSIDGANIRLVTPLAGTYGNSTATTASTGTTAVEAALPRFDASLDWVRARLKNEGAPAFSRVNGIYPNAVWATQTQTINNETLGSGTGQPNQLLTFQQFPVLEGEQVQVRELYGAQASVEFLVLQEQLVEQGFTDKDIRTVTDPRSGLINEVWVTWRGQPNFYFSGPEDRHYVLDRASGRIQFGNFIRGMLPAMGNSNIMAYRYKAGGGLAGNVGAGSITQLLGGATAKSVNNPAAAEGGADTEPATNVSWRGPQVLRHRGAALAAADYEALALQASPGVAITRCLPATDMNLRPAPGWVTLILVPRSLDPQPEPSYELKQEVTAYLAERAPCSIESGRIRIIPPDYLPVGISAQVTATQIDQSGSVKVLVVAELNRFFHPLYGGPDGRGWPFGRGVYLSDVATVLDGIVGVDHVTQLMLMIDEVPVGESVSVPPNQLIAAGAMQIVMEGAPNV